MYGVTTASGASDTCARLGCSDSVLEGVGSVTRAILGGATGASTTGLRTHFATGFFFYRLVHPLEKRKRRYGVIIIYVVYSLTQLQTVPQAYAVGDELDHNRGELVAVRREVLREDLGETERRQATLSVG